MNERHHVRVCLTVSVMTEALSLVFQILLFAAGFFRRISSESLFPSWLRSLAGKRPHGGRRRALDVKPCRRSLLPAL